jgi:hypothetical protein
MQLRHVHVLITAAAVCVAGSASAAVKAYDSSNENGVAGDVLNTAPNLCPPVQTRPGTVEGFAILDDAGAGTVTLTDLNVITTFFGDLGPDQLTITFGPGAFVFIDARASQTPAAAQLSNTRGIGAHGPSGTAPGETAEWGILSAWTATGFRFCVSSPIGICNNAGFVHGVTVDSIVNSDTYDLGTWNFDAVGDFSNEAPYIFSTANGGLQNIRYVLRGSFSGASLPAVPLLGFGALALSLVVVGTRALLGRK